MSWDWYGGYNQSEVTDITRNAGINSLKSFNKGPVFRDIEIIDCFCYIKVRIRIEPFCEHIALMVQITLDTKIRGKIETNFFLILEISSEFFMHRLV